MGSNIYQIKSTRKPWRLLKNLHVIEKLKTPEMDVPQKIDCFWQVLKENPISFIYGSAIDNSSCFAESESRWNLNQLEGSILKKLEVQVGVFPGITKSYSYVGQFGSAFGMHTEDGDLFSGSRLHQGDPKVWSSTSPADKKKVEAVLDELFKENKQACSGHMRHKMMFVHQQVLASKGIQVYYTIQEAGDYIVTWPGQIHWGMNLGRNYAEACNFANRDWIKYGLQATACDCALKFIYNVQIPMNLFVNEFLPNMYQDFIDGKLDFKNPLLSLKDATPTVESLTSKSVINDSPESNIDIQGIS